MSEPVILFGATDGVGAITGCELISDSPNTTKKEARALGSSGDEKASDEHDVMTEYTSLYNILSDTNDVADLILGALMNSRMVTRISIKTKAGDGDDYNQVEFTSHNHAVNPHADTLKQLAIADALPETGIPAYGAVDFLAGTAGDSAECTAGEITFECQHDDKTGGDGNHVVGQNFDAMVNASSDWLGVPTTPRVAGWRGPSYETPKTNTSFQTSKVSGKKTLGVLAAPA